VATLAEAYGLNVDPDAKIWQLSVGEQQRVEILKALDLGASLIILDEPTAVLTPQEVEELFRTLRHMVSEGHSLLFISHKLHEVLDVSDQITVLRDGVTIGTRATADVTRPELIRMMVDAILNRSRGPVGRMPTRGRRRSRLTGLSVRGDRGEALRPGALACRFTGERSLASPASPATDNGNSRKRWSGFARWKAAA
jgi:ABC-type uncharacterized transport system ATPase subunit